MARPAENVVAFYNKRGTCEQWIKEGKARSSGRGYHVGRLPPTPSVSSFMRWPTISAISAHFGDAGADQGLVADEPKGKADQDRREGREPRPLRRLPDGRGRYPEKSVRRHPAVHRGTATAA
jgi:hypothetical protein